MNGVDLFGEPIVPPRGPGRPSHEPTASTRADVAALAQQGFSRIAIAQAIGITVPTLHFHYFRELERGPPPEWHRRAGRERST